MVNAFPWDTAPRYLVRDRDQTYGAYFDSRVDGLGIEQVLTAPRSPWQNPLVERMIGSIRRECLDHVIVLDERHLRRILRKYVDYYHSCRTHLSLEKDAPEPRRVESPAMGKVRAIPKVGGTIVKPTALGPGANTDTKLLIYGLFQKGRVLAQDGVHDTTFFQASGRLKLPYRKSY